MSSDSTSAKPWLPMAAKVRGYSRAITSHTLSPVHVSSMTPDPRGPKILKVRVMPWNQNGWLDSSHSSPFSSMTHQIL
ncbi:MAG: hypothetical protein IKP53_08410 [Candidatus Methanomethylophilaceae archaeon]|nr:hypothetical protein [Candidatus Methanomethylophilaceae archaeon]